MLQLPLSVPDNPEPYSCPPKEALQSPPLPHLLTEALQSPPLPPRQTEALLLARAGQMAGSSTTCHICGQSFLDRITLARHQVEAHTMEKTFSCTQCDKTFKELRTLRLHLKIHNSEYPEQCAVCKKVFRTKWQLKQHVMDHGGERPYPCPECTFTCKTKQQLNEHRRKHSGEKAYSCSQCNTRFTYRNGLIKHTKLNRCPKKILTAEGETIVKKRTRIIPKDPLAQDLKDSNNNPFGSGAHPPPTSATTISEKTNLDSRILDSIQRRAAARLQLSAEEALGGEAVGDSLSLGEGQAAAAAGAEAGCLSLGEAAEAGCLSLGLLNSLTSSGPGSGQSPTILTTSADISSWAATLPAGTKVTVTHYDASKKHGQLELIATPTHTETIIVTQQKSSDRTTTLTTTTTTTNHQPSTTTTTGSPMSPAGPVRLPPQLSAAKHGPSGKVVLGLAPFLQGAVGTNTSSQLLLQGATGTNNSQLLLQGVAGSNSSQLFLQGAGGGNTSQLLLQGATGSNSSSQLLLQGAASSSSGNQLLLQGVAGNTSNQLLLQGADGSCSSHQSMLLHGSGSSNNHQQQLLMPRAASAASSSSSQLLLPHHHHNSSHLYHSQEALNLFSSIGVPNYTESFAVDPNEILLKEKFIKSEPSTPTPKAADFRPVFHNVRVPTTKADLLFKVEPLEPAAEAAFTIKQEAVGGDDGCCSMAVAEPTVITAATTSHLMRKEVVGHEEEEEEISVHDIKKEVLSELFDCEPDYCDGGADESSSFLDAAAAQQQYEEATMQYSDDSQDDDFSECLLQSAAADDYGGGQGDFSSSSSASSGHSLKLEALSPMSSFDSEPVPQTPEFYMSREDVFKAHFDMDLSQLLDDDITDMVEDSRTALFIRRLSCKEEDDLLQIRSIMSGLRSKIY